MNSTSVQQDVFAFLSDPATYGGVPVKRIDTHAAAVFLAGSRALKVKRAVRFPFLDFSTLAKRRAACEAEIEANRPFAPELYHGVVAITREPDRRFAIGGKGKPVEWAVDMWRFDETQTLDQIADRSGIDIALADQLAQRVGNALRLGFVGSKRSPLISARTRRRSPRAKRSTARPSAKR